MNPSDIKLLLDRVIKVDRTRPAEYGDYLHAVKHYLNVLPLKNIRSVYQVGSVGVPGLSDIDLIIVFKDSSRDSIFKYSLRKLNEFDRYLFSHSPWFVDTPTFCRLSYWFSYYDLRHVYGDRLCVDKEYLEDSIMQSILLVGHLYFKVPSDFIRYSGLYVGKFYERIMIAMINSLRHSFKLRASVTGISLDKDELFDKDFSEFRLRWYETDKKRREIELKHYVVEAIQYGLRLQKEISRFAETSWIAGPLPDGGDWFFKLDRFTTLIFSEQWSPEYSIELMMKTQGKERIYPKALGLLLAAISEHPSYLGKSVRTRFSSQGICEWSFSEKFREFVDRHVSAVDGYRIFHSKKFGCNILIYHGYGCRHSSSIIKVLVDRIINQSYRLWHHGHKLWKVLLDCRKL